MMPEGSPEVSPEDLVTLMLVVMDVVKARGPVAHPADAWCLRERKGTSESTSAHA